jgi:hypothetical protein
LAAALSSKLLRFASDSFFEAGGLVRGRWKTRIMLGSCSDIHYENVWQVIKISSARPSKIWRSRRQLFASLNSKTIFSLLHTALALEALNEDDRLAGAH